MRSRKTLVVLASIAAAAIAIWLLFLRGGGGHDDAKTAPPAAKDDPWAKPVAPKVKDTPPPAPGAAPIFLRDADPAGALRLEGQVVDADNKPVGGAGVWLGP